MSTRGFTLIELVMVIVILGILSAIALPKFAKLNSQSQTASNRGIAGSLASAASIAHATWISGGAQAGGNVTLEGTAVHVNSAGWPDNSKGITPLAADCVIIWGAILNNPPTATAGACAGTATCYVATVTAGSSGNSACLFTLNGASATTTTSYDLNNGAVAASP